MKQKLKLIAVMLACFCYAGLHAQQAVTTAGGNASGSGGSSSFTVGQAAYTTVTGSGGTITLGVQQPFEILVVTGIREAKGITLESSVYPNPTTESVTLKIDQYALQDLTYQLYDIKGQLLLYDKISSSETFIPMNNLAAAAYFLKITDKNDAIKTFKIIKNQ